MGDMADYYREQEDIAEAMADQQDGPEITRESLWRMRDAQEVYVKDMENEHLLNTIRMLQGRSPIGTVFGVVISRRRAWISVMTNEAYRRGLELL